MAGSIFGSMAYWPSGLRASTSVCRACCNRSTPVTSYQFAVAHARMQQSLAARKERLTVDKGMIRSTLVDSPVWPAKQSTSQALQKRARAEFGMWCWSCKHVCLETTFPGKLQSVFSLQRRRADDRFIDIQACQVKETVSRCDHTSRCARPDGSFTRSAGVADKGLL